MRPPLRQTLDKDLFGGVADLLLGASRLHSPHMTVRRRIGQRAAHMTLDQRESKLFQSYLCMLQLLELHEGKVKVLEERSKVKKQPSKKLPKLTKF